MTTLLEEKLPLSPSRTTDNLKTIQDHGRQRGEGEGGLGLQDFDHKPHGKVLQEMLADGESPARNQATEQKKAVWVAN